LEPESGEVACGPGGVELEGHERHTHELETLVDGHFDCRPPVLGARAAVGDPDRVVDIFVREYWGCAA